MTTHPHKSLKYFIFAQVFRPEIPIERVRWNMRNNGVIFPVGLGRLRWRSWHFLGETSSPIFISSSSIAEQSDVRSSRSVRSSASDCVLVEKPPEVIVIDDDDEKIDEPLVAANPNNIGDNNNERMKS